MSVAGRADRNAGDGSEVLDHHEPAPAIVALAGIVVNNNIVLIDTFQELARKNVGRWRRSCCTAEQRIRPVLLTTITTMAGLDADDVRRPRSDFGSTGHDIPGGADRALVACFLATAVDVQAWASVTVHDAGRDARGTGGAHLDRADAGHVPACAGLRSSASAVPGCKQSREDAQLAAAPCRKQKSESNWYSRTCWACRNLRNRSPRPAESTATRARFAAASLSHQ